MEKKEKVEFILEQMRLCLAKKDYIRTQIISKKINTKYFEDAGTTVCIVYNNCKLLMTVKKYNLCSNRLEKHSKIILPTIR